MPDSPDKKQILRDPASAYTALPSASNAVPQQLTDLAQQQQQLQQQADKQQQENKKLSRRIGKAKKAGKDMDALDRLLNEMKTGSATFKQLKAEQAVVEDNILSFFRNNKATESNTNKAVVGELPKRRHLRSDISIDGISIHELSDSPADSLTEWNHYVKQHPDGCIHHRSEWKTILQSTYNHNCLYLFARNHKEGICGVLPLVQLNSRLFGNLLVSMPWFQRGGALADNPAIEDRLMAAAAEHATVLGCEHIEYRDNIPREALPVNTHKVNMVLSLPTEVGQLWQQFKPKLRAQIRRSQRAQPAIHFGREELLDDFYRIYSRNMRDLGSPVHNKTLIATILRQFPDNSWLAVVYLHHKPVSAGFLLADKDTMEIPLASTIRNVNHLSTNMFLYWEILQFAIQQGYRHFDFGRSTRGAGTYNFKKQWGARPMLLHWHYWLHEGTELPGLNPDNPKFKLVIAVWKHLPIWLSRLLGPAIVKNIP